MTEHETQTGKPRSSVNNAGDKAFGNNNQRA
jgi:hypothetical protein